jgi:ERF superfamily
MIEHSDTLAKLAASLAKAQAEMSAITKSKTVQTGKYSYTYADLASVLDAALPALNKNGVALVQGVGADGGTIIVSTRLIDSSGEWIGSSLPMTPTNSDPQSQGSAVTYARRYAVMALCGLAPEDDDGAGASKPGQAQVAPTGDDEAERLLEEYRRGQDQPTPRRPRRERVAPPSEPVAPSGPGAPGSITQETLAIVGRGLAAAFPQGGAEPIADVIALATNGRLGKGEAAVPDLSEHEGRRLVRELAEIVRARNAQACPACGADPTEPHRRDLAGTPCPEDDSADAGFRREALAALEGNRAAVRARSPHDPEAEELPW